MIKKMLFLLALMMTVNLSAQQKLGDWNVHKYSSMSWIASMGKVIEGSIMKKRYTHLQLRKINGTNEFLFSLTGVPSSKEVSIQVVFDGDRSRSLTFRGDRFNKGVYRLEDFGNNTRKELFRELSNSGYIHVKVRDGGKVLFIASYLTKGFEYAFSEIK